MRAVVVYESMYGNTRAVAEAIAEGLGAAYDVLVAPVSRVVPETVDGARFSWSADRPTLTA